MSFRSFSPLPTALTALASLAAGVVAAAPPPKKPAPPSAAAKAAAAKAAAAKAAAAKAAAAKAGKKPVVIPPARKGVLQPLPSRGGLKLPSPATPPTASAVPKPNAAPASTPTPPAPISVPPTFFQTNVDYDYRIDLKSDFVAVHRHGSSWEEIDKSIASWRLAGYPVYRMFFIGSDAGQYYTGGKFDALPHPGDIEMDANGNPIVLGDRPYMVPTAGWLSYLKEHIRRAIDSGVEGILPEEPLMHSASGYSPAFKAAWQQFYNQPWQAPNSSPEAFFRGSRLKADLYLQAVSELAQFTRQYAKDKGKNVRFLLPVHSPISYASWNHVFPHAAAAKLPIDGFIAQVWTGPARSPVTYEGKSSSQFFESNWLLYSYFASLMEGVNDRALYFLADPVEDDPNYSWPEYESWYKDGLAASLLFPQARGYEVMPWPDRIYLPRQGTAKGVPPPASYLTQLGAISAALKELPSTGPLRWEGGTRGVGVITLDSLMWQRGGPQGSTMRSLHGLTLPLLKRGIPVEVVPGERAGDKEYLSRYKVLLVSYDAQKPLSNEVNRHLSEWVKAGGVLIAVGGEDAYNQIGEWWNRNGFVGPTDHLLRQCSAGVEVALRAVRGGKDRFTPVQAADAQVRSLENRKSYSFRPADMGGTGKPFYLRFTDQYPSDGWGAWVGRVRVLEGGKTRADFRAGTPGESAFLYEQSGTQIGGGPNGTHRFADGEASFTYRFNRLGPDATVEVELGNQFQVAAATGDDPTVALEPTGAPVPAPAAAGATSNGSAPASALTPVSAASRYPLVTYPLSSAQPLLKVKGEDSAAAWVSPHGSGALIYCGLPAAYFADSRQGGDLLRGLVRSACERARVPYTEGAMIGRRGPYVIANGLGKSINLKGQYLDLFHPDLPLVQDPQLPYGHAAFYKTARLTGGVPGVLHGTHRVTVLNATATQTKLQLDGPEGTTGVLRIFPAGNSLSGVDAIAPLGKKVEVEAKIEGPTVLVRYPQSARGITLTLRWNKAEARLTK